MTENHFKCGFLIAIFCMSHHLTFSQTESTVESHPGIILERTEASYAGTHADLDADVFMSSGELESLTTEKLDRMVEQLQSRNYKSLRLETFIFENESHVTCYPAALSRGLVELFNNEDGE